MTSERQLLLGLDELAPVLTGNNMRSQHYFNNAHLHDQRSFTSGRRNLYQHILQGIALNLAV